MEQKDRDRIIEIARAQLKDAADPKDNQVDVTVDYRHDDDAVRSYVVTFQKQPESPATEMVAVEITEVSSW